MTQIVVSGAGIGVGVIGVRSGGGYHHQCHRRADAFSACSSVLCPSYSFSVHCGEFCTLLYQGKAMSPPFVQQYRALSFFFVKSSLFLRQACLSLPL